MNLFLRSIIRKAYLVIQITLSAVICGFLSYSYAVWQGFLALIYPPHCLLCRTPIPDSGGLCKACWIELEVIQGHRCRRCGCPSTEEVEICFNCSEKQYRFSQLFVLSPFNGSIQQMIHMFKYQGRSLPARVLGERLGGEMVTNGFAGGDIVVVPVPLHSSRKRERGYNQSALISQGISRVTGSRVFEDILTRIRATETQTALAAGERKANVDEAFRVRRPHRIQHRVVLLVDDVVTTGSTVNACADALFLSGAKDVLVAAISSPFRSSKEDPKEEDGAYNRLDTNRVMP